MLDLGKLLIALGLVLVAIGVLLTFAGRFHGPLGHLPGDILYRKKNITVYFPLATSILMSLVLTLLVYLVGRWKK
jgi:Protein of unknown function (DUF2905)